MTPRPEIRVPSPIDRRTELQRQVRDQGWVEGGRVVVMTPADDDYLTPGEAREFGRKYLAAADIAEGGAPGGHGGPHVCEWSLETVRSSYLLAGPPVVRTTLRLVVEYDDPVCADRAASEVTALLRMGDWWQPL